MMDKRILKRLEADISSILWEYSGLMAYYKSKVPQYIYGTFSIRDNNYLEQGSWEIKIPIPKGYPFEFPFLIETSGKIPIEDDRHMLNGNIACLELDIICRAVAKKGISLKLFLDKYVFKYFCWQLLYSLDEKSSLNSWRHKNDGRKDLFYEILNTRDDAIVSQSLTMLEKNKRTKPNESCFCKSGKKFKRCHGPGIAILNHQYGNDILDKYKSLFHPVT